MTMAACRRRVAGLLAAAVLALAASPAAAAAGEALRIGSKRFTESYVLAEVLAAQVRTTGTPVVVSAGLGNTAIVAAALAGGTIDVYPEYSGTIARELLQRTDLSDVAALHAALASRGLGVAVPLGFQNGYALAMRASEAERLQIRTLADLARHPELRPGLSNEFLGRADGWPGLAAHYRLAQRPRAIDHGLAYQALEAGQIDLVDAYTTDAQVARRGLRLLADGDGWFPRYDAVLLYRLDLPERLPAAWAALRQLEGRIDEGRMAALNARAEIDGASFATVAQEALTGAVEAAGATPGATGNAARSPPGWRERLFGPDLARLTRQHLTLVVVSVGLAVLAGVPLAVVSLRRPRLRAVLLSAASLLQTVPSLALLAALISWMGTIGTAPALIALALYALLPVMRNTVTGLDGVTTGMRQAATALGMTRGQLLMLVELPLALPVILAGVRTATTIAIGTATLAAFIGAGGFGERIVTGLALNDHGLLLAGALPAAALALASEAMFSLVDRMLPRARGH